MTRVTVLHGAGYVGRELVRLLLHHPSATLTCVTSRTYGGQPLHVAHPMLRGQHALVFSDPADFDHSNTDAVLVAAEHGKGAQTISQLLENGYTGPVIDLSADLRFGDIHVYETLFNITHPAPALAADFHYGLAEIFAPYPSHRVANPGCFATGLLLSLWPLHQNLGVFQAAITALTGASGSGARPKATTHFPDREGNVRAYKVLSHQHLPEILQFLDPATRVAFVPVSGPWTRGIWGTVHVTTEADEITVGRWFKQTYSKAACVRLWPGILPELHYAVGTPYCDLGWVVHKGQLVIGFALDNMLKGAASQAIQNLNLIMGWPETAGLVPYR